MTDSIAITLDLPPAAVSQNQARVGHWSKKSAAIRKARKYAKMETFLQLVPPVRWKKARISGHFYYPDARRRDLLNSIGSLKPYIDGIVDAGVLADDDGITEVGKFGREIDRESPRVLIYLERIE